ncbi:MAG: TetR/AcrR family transcriptional regulator [Micropruina sp.]|nr:TetR/AcrR family transcriptional regulator [Micropruina sp.]
MAPDARRRAILDAAQARFAADPYPEVSLAAIAADAGASEALIHKYFDGKAGLYVEVVQGELDRLAQRQHAALDALPPNTNAQDHVRASLEVYLDEIAASPRAWLTTFRDDPSDPAAETLRAARAAWVDQLQTHLLPDESPRRHYALWGYFGFLDAACREWIHRGCPPQERWPLIEAALGSLQGALGDWGR